MSRSVDLVCMGNIGQCPHLAVGLSRAGLLHRWYAGLYYDPRKHGWLGRVLPRMKARHHPELDPSKVQTLPHWELGRIAMTRADRLARQPSRTLGRWLERLFTREVARRLTRKPPGVVIGTNHTALEVFLAARELGVTTVETT